MFDLGHVSSQLARLGPAVFLKQDFRPAHARNSRSPRLLPAPQPCSGAGTDCSEQPGPFANPPSWLGLLFIATHSATDLLQDPSYQCLPSRLLLTALEVSPRLYKRHQLIFVIVVTQELI